MDAQVNTSDLRLIIRGFDTPYTLPVIQGLLDELRPSLVCFFSDPLHFPERASVRPIVAPGSVEFRERNIRDFMETSP